MTADNEHGEKTATVSMMVALEDRDDLVRAMREVDIVQGHWKKVTSSIKGFVHTFHSKCESALLIDTSINKIVENREKHKQIPRLHVEKSLICTFDCHIY